MSSHAAQSQTPNGRNGIGPMIGAMLVALLAFALLQGIPRPEHKGVHWDVASYLRMARQEVEQMPMTARYDWDAERTKLAAGDATDRYRKLARYGHIWFLAQLYRAAGPGLRGLQTSMAVYTGLLAGALLLLLLLLCEGERLFAPPHRHVGSIAAPLAAVLFLSGGGMVQYLNGQLVSEVPALILLAAAACLLLRGLSAQAPARAALWGGGAGLLLGALYIVRLESVWTNAALLLALGVVFARDRAVRPKVLALIGGAALTGLTVLALWIAHVGPVGSPFYFVQYATAYAVKTPIALSRQNVLFALGPAAILMPLTLFARPWRAVLVAWLWFALAAFPLALVYFREGPVEARMFGVLLPPLAGLLGLAAVGVSRLVWRPGATRAVRRSIVCGVPALFALLGLVLQGEAARDALARWTGTGPWAVVAHEALDYPFEDLAPIAALLDEAGYPALQVLRGPEFTWSVYVSFLSYLQTLPFQEVPGAGTPFAARPEGPWFALVSASQPVQDLQHAALSQYPELHQHQVQVQQPYTGQALVLFQVVPLPRP